MACNGIVTAWENKKHKQYVTGTSKNGDGVSLDKSTYLVLTKHTIDDT